MISIRARMQEVRFCKIDGCCNLLFGKSVDFCHDGHRHLYHSTARQVGRRVMVMRPDILRRLIDAALSNDDAALRTVLGQPARNKSIERIDLTTITPQERLGELCRAAKKIRVISGL